MKAYYEVLVIGDGLSRDGAFRPDLLEGAGGWVLCSEPQSAPTVTVLVAGDIDYHNTLRANPGILWLADAGSRPRDRALAVGHADKARAFFRAHYRQPLLPPGEVTQRRALDVVLALHGRTWADVQENDVGA